MTTLDMDQVAKWYASGLSLRDIAARTGVGAKTVHRHMVNAGVPRREPGWNPPPSAQRRVTPEETQAIRTAIAEGGRAETVARQFRRSEATIQKVAGDLLKGRREAELEQVRALHGEGLRTVEIARKLGWNLEKVRCAKQRLGLPGRIPVDPAHACALYQELGTVKAVADRLRISSTRVSSILTDAGIDLGRYGPQPHRLDAHLPELRRAYVEERVPLGELAARYGCKPTTLSGYLASRGMPPRGRRTTAAEREQILAMRASGMTQAAIGRHFGISDQSVRWHLNHQQQQRSRKEG